LPLLARFKPAIGLVFGLTFRHFQYSLGQPQAMNVDLRNRNVDIAEVFSREVDVDRTQVFFEAVQLRRTRNWNNPRFLCEQPCERNLRRSPAFAAGDFLQQIDDGLVRGACFRSEAR
jgi:hypothetical protein